MQSALSNFIDAMFAYHEQLFEKAHKLTEKAADAEPDSLFYRQAMQFLAGVVENKSSDVYASPEGFAAFIRGGGNVPLYTSTSAQLKKLYDGNGPATLLDIGVGDGHALLPALSENITHLDLVEPSTAMLKSLAQKLGGYDLQFQLHPRTWQAFHEEIEQNRHWDIIQMTFSAHSFMPQERAELLKWCAQKCEQLLLVEFDVPLFETMLDAETIGFYVEKYELGLAEYADNELVMQRFLMPVFFGNFAHDSQRYTFEQPAENWVSDLKKAGFANIERYPIFDYWWGQAFLLQVSV